MNGSLEWIGVVARRGVVALGLGVMGLIAALPAGTAAAASTGCRLGPGGSIRHVIIMQFDNVHLERDAPETQVPSDLEQIPALYNFLRGQGTLLSNDHTALISHTADGITSTETGLYPGDEGLGVSNSFEYFTTDDSRTANQSAFTYWTDPIETGTSIYADPNFEMIDQSGQNTPAPWVPFTRAGCDFAGIGAANMEFENDLSDVANVYGKSSPQSQLGNWSYNTAYDATPRFYKGADLGTTDFEGLAIHCSYAQSQTGGLCSNANGGAPDSLPDEPGGYMGYNALYGALGVDPVLTGQADQPLPADYVPSSEPASLASALANIQGNWQAPPVYDVFAPNADNAGRHAAPVDNLEASGGSYPNYNSGPPQSYKPGVTPTSQILDEDGNAGFPGFDGMEANNALGYTAAAQEAGIPVTYTYISDVHDDQYYTNNGFAFGPGEAGHEAQLREYNAAFTAFFRRLAHDGINSGNTLFVATVDEGDHYDGGPALNPGCNGVTTPCDYDTGEAGGPTSGQPGFSRNEGEVDADLNAMFPNTTFGFDFDDAPAILVPHQPVNGKPTAGPLPGQDSDTVRDLERALGSTQLYNPIVGHDVPITVNLADQVEEGILHMVNGDPRRTPTFTLFGDPSFYFQASCDGNASAFGCPVQNPDYAWNHGDIQPEIASTWQGWVGPGVENLGETGAVWTDHTDVRPTLLTLLGLHDDYGDDGDAIAQILATRALPQTIRVHGRSTYEQLEAAYKQLDAPFGAFGLDTLTADTSAIESGSDADDSTYTEMDAQLQTCASARSALAGQIQSVLQAAQDGLAPISRGEARSLVDQANALIADASSLASDATPPSGPVCS